MAGWPIRRQLLSSWTRWQRASVSMSCRKPAIHRRFTMATATLLHQVFMASLTQVITADPVAMPILQRFSSDGSMTVRPLGCLTL